VHKLVAGCTCCSRIELCRMQASAVIAARLWRVASWASLC